jgi:hypothetical protein
MSQHGRATVVIGTAVLALLCAGVLGAITVGGRSSRQETQVAALLTQDVQSPANREDGLALASPLPSAEPATDAPSTTTTTTTTTSAPSTTPTPPAPSNTTPAPSLDPPPTPFPVNPATGNPATVQPYAPGAWRLTHNGITVEARIDPPSPNVGDTVRFTFSASGAGDYCCDLFLYMGNEPRPLFPRWQPILGRRSPVRDLSTHPGAAPSPLPPGCAPPISAAPRPR